MSFFTQAVTLVSQPPGNFVYHILSLLALEAALAMAIGQYRRTPDPGSRQLAMAAGAALTTRLTLVVIAALGALGLVYDDVALPPLDRAVSLITYLLFAWALSAGSGNNITNGVFGALIIIVVVIAIVGLLIWQPDGIRGVAYNDTFQSKLWHTAQIGVLAAIAASLAWKQPDDWGIAIVMFALPAFASLGHLYQALTFHTLSGHIPALNRFAELGTLPMFTVIVYRRVLSIVIHGSAGHADTMPARLLAEIQDKPGGALPVAALKGRLQRLQQEWDELEARMGELGAAEHQGARSSGESLD